MLAGSIKAADTGVKEKPVNLDKLRNKRKYKSMTDAQIKSAVFRKRLRIKQNIPLWVMISIPLLYFLIFCYGPMFGLVMAFQNFRLKDGFFGSEWVGLQNFKMIFSNPNMVKIIWNTVWLGLLTVLVEFPFPIIIAIFLNEIENKHFKKWSQTILYLPHFFSWVILGGMVITLFSYGGPINRLLEMLGHEKIGFLINQNSWIAVFLGSGVWKEMGYGAIIYLAALTSIDPGLYEAAKVDGANKWKQITRITLPCLMPTIILMFILSIGKVTSVGFDKIYVLRNDAVYDVSNVVSVFSYEFGARKGNFSIATAMGLFDSVVSLILVMFTNHLAKRTDSGGLF